MKALSIFISILCIGILLIVITKPIYSESFQTEQTTVVTSFYPIKSKRSPDQYMDYAKTFMKLSAPIVLFTDESYAERLRAMRPAHLQLNVVVRPFEELDTWKLYKSEWVKHHSMDHETYHSPELYSVWSQKAFFVDEVVKSNPFQTTTFYWCDIGAFRDPDISPSILYSFPRADILSSISPAILLHSVNSLTKEDIETGDFKHVDRIAGGLWGGTALACKRWKKAYQEMLEQYFSKNIFAGKDQSVMLSTYLADPSLAVIVQPTSQNKWFFQQDLLSSANASFEKDQTYLLPSKK
jgi:hypothetical protein